MLIFTLISALVLALALVARFKFIQRMTIISVWLMASSAVMAHDGHGMMDSSHWHVTDIWGFVALAAVGVAIWLGRGGR